MSITWNGTTSDSIGVIVERIPDRYIPTRRFSPQKVAGRNGDILLVDKSFPNVEQEYEVYLSAESAGLPSVARACAEWLMEPTGYEKLRDSYDTSTFRLAYLSSGFDIENVLNKFGKCKITFSCKPQRFLDSGDSYSTVASGGTLTNPTPFDAQPLLLVRTTGPATLTVNGKSIDILDVFHDLSIDCETMEATDTFDPSDPQPANTAIYCEDFPILSKGNNVITYTAGVHSLSVKPRWWTL